MALNLFVSATLERSGSQIASTSSFSARSTKIRLIAIKAKTPIYMYISGHTRYGGNGLLEKVRHGVAQIKGANCKLEMEI
jgi:hypothetical protein